MQSECQQPQHTHYFHESAGTGTNAPTPSSSDLPPSGDVLSRSNQAKSSDPSGEMIDLKRLCQQVRSHERRLLSLMEVPRKLEQLFARMDLFEGKVNMIKSTVEQLQLMVNSDPTYDSGNTTAENVWDGEGFLDISSALTTIIKQEKNDEIYIPNEDDDNWHKNYITEDYGDEDDQEYRPKKGLKTKSGRSVSRPRRYDQQQEKRSVKIKNRILNETETDPCSEPWIPKLEDTDLEPQGQEDNLPKRFVIEPNHELLKKSKELLGRVLADPVTGKFACPECQKGFNHKKDLTRHHFIHTGLKPYQCTQCNASFARGDKLSRHILTQHVRSTKSTASDDVKKKNKKMMTSKGEDGVTITEGSKPLKSERKESYPCSDCGKPFRSARDLKRHSDVHVPLSERATFTCEVCAKSYTRSDGLALHQRNVHGEAKDIDAVVHIERKKSAPVKSYICPEENCGKSFSSRSKLKIHVSACRGLKPFNCDQCESTFTQKVGLTQHLAAVHQKVKRYLCTDCGKGFYGSGTYQRHLRMHRGIRPYNCKYCGKSFTGISDVQRHEMIHTGIRKVDCPLCSLKFYRRSTLRRHMLVHTGEKPFVCDECGARFSQKGSLNKHQQCHSKGSARGSFNRNHFRDDKRARVETKPRESRLLRELERKEFQESAEIKPSGFQDSSSLSQQSHSSNNLMNQQLQQNEPSSSLIPKIPIGGMDIPHLL